MMDDVVGSTPQAEINDHTNIEPSPSRSKVISFGALSAKEDTSLGLKPGWEKLMSERMRSAANQ